MKQRSTRGFALMAAGVIGVLASLAFAVLVLLDFMAPATLLGGAVFAAGVAAMAMFTGGRIEGWERVALCLSAPLPGAVLVWLGLRALGL